MPWWIIPAFVLTIAVGVAGMAFTFSKCGSKALLLGSGAFAAAAMGMCDE